jgi:hypothetical protein
MKGNMNLLDWDDASEQQEPDLWEENWDDDVVGEDFAFQLRQELQKTGEK